MTVKPTQEDPLETRVHDLEMEWATLRQELKDAAMLVDNLGKEVKWLRKRLSQLLPERHHCPKCKATVHAVATNCGACGASWGKRPDPDSGLPQ